MEDKLVRYLPFKTEHLEKASLVYVDGFNGPPWYDDWTLDTARERLSLLLRYPNFVGFVATTGDEIVGLVVGNCEPWSDGTSYYLNELCISPKKQRSGIGQSLLKALINELREMEVKYVYLLTEHGSIAESYFIAQGFEVDSSAIKMWKSVD